MRNIWKRISDAYERILLFFYRKRAVFLISAEALALAALTGCLLLKAYPRSPAASCLLSLLSQQSIGAAGSDPQKDDFIKWVDFNVPEEAMTKAFRLDVATCQQQLHLNWIELLAFLGARYGGDFSSYLEADMDELASRLQSGISMEQLTADMRNIIPTIWRPTQPFWGAWWDIMKSRSPPQRPPPSPWPTPQSRRTIPPAALPLFPKAAIPAQLVKTIPSPARILKRSGLLNMA